MLYCLLAIRSDERKKLRERAHLANSGKYNRRYLICQISAILCADLYSPCFSSRPKKKAYLEEIENSNTKGSKFWEALPDWFIYKNADLIRKQDFFSDWWILIQTQTADTESGALIQYKLSPCLEQADLIYSSTSGKWRVTRIWRQQLQYSNNKTSGHKIRAKALVNVVTYRIESLDRRLKMEMKKLLSLFFENQR